MMHNALSRSMDMIPMWIMQALVGILLTSGVAWATWASVSSWQHEQRIAVVEDHQKNIDKSLDEIKSMQRTQAEDTKKILERLPRR
jgi:hypothetical protein